MLILLISTTFVSALIIWMLVFFSDEGCVFLNIISLWFKIKKAQQNAGLKAVNN